MLQILPVFFKKLMAVQPMFKHIVKRCHVRFPLLTGNTYWHGMPPDDHEVGVGKRCLQKARHKKVPRSFLDEDRFAVVPMGVPARLQPGDLFRRQQARGFCPVCAWIEAESPGPTKHMGSWINILQELSLVHVYPGILEVGTIL